jgi:signal peptidase I
MTDDPSDEGHRRMNEEQNYRKSYRSTGEFQSVWQVWLRDFVIAAVVAAFIILFVYQPVRVEGTSMLPQLEDQDRLFINKFAYHIGPIQRGDVVVFYYPRDPEKSYIKRVAGLPGERIVVDRGRVYINGRLLVENYVPAQYRDRRSIDPITLGPTQYFVLGDHRSISSDSREFGPVERDLIYGRAEFVIWPARDLGAVR